MNNTIALLNRVKAAYHLDTDYQLAKFLEVNTGRITHYMKRGTILDWETAFKIADLLKIDDRKVVQAVLSDKYDNARLINSLDTIDR